MHVRNLLETMFPVRFSCSQGSEQSSQGPAQGRYEPLKRRLCSAVAVLSLSAMLAACSTTPRVPEHSAKPVWVQKVVSYQSSLPLDHPDRNELVLAITPEMKEQVTNRFSLMPKHQAAKEMALWLLDENGHDMVYDVEASLTPVQSFAQRKGNCLSFTLLLAALTRELGIDCLLYTSPSPRDKRQSRMPSSA